jgi:3-methyladenine DNA glycosylase AlkD
MAARQKRLHVLVKDLSRDFRLQADAKVAAGYSAYMRNQFPFLGLRAPVRRQVQKGVFAKHGLEDGQELTTVLKQLWKMEEREYQMAAIDLAVKYKKLWTQGTSASVPRGTRPSMPSCSCATKSFHMTEMFETFEYMVRNKSWWDVRAGPSAWLKWLRCSHGMRVDCGPGCLQAGGRAHTEAPGPGG